MDFANRPSGKSISDPDFRRAVRCGIDTVDIARIERLLATTPLEELGKLFSPSELGDAGHGEGRAASLAARY
ncbi:MAG TPA: hypothetical protein VFS06_11335, partial [Casimicrobiaceae bacterium]|nr:hypothetical protein [Casimicrobiaceae bacterium]